MGNKKTMPKVIKFAKNYFIFKRYITYLMKNSHIHIIE
ncbi:hypothetical protein BN134_629 [Cronobacter dublinensis 1210]|uniref:Uncharacterized protein n=1 Tax=Cronobacter dublinensis 1210 TaxID=1208656 RepID=A0ABP1W496_9ENTR|nr:hypothetical protein BN134_629 [Cronobacter dublinensis 1210]